MGNPTAIQILRSKPIIREFSAHFILLANTPHLVRV